MSAPMCEEDYYPPWSSRGIRAVHCTRPAKFTVPDEHKIVCGIHAAAHKRRGHVVLAGIWTNTP